MEESVWLYVGVIAVLIAIAILASLLKRFQADNQEQTLFGSLTQLVGQADLVCKSPRHTMLSIRVLLPAESRVYAKENALCATLTGKVQCKRLGCVIPDGDILNLTGASELFSTHQYTCAFLNEGEDRSGVVQLSATCAG